MWRRLHGLGTRMKDADTGGQLTWSSGSEDESLCHTPENSDQQFGIQYVVLPFMVVASTLSRYCSTPHEGKVRTSRPRTH
jgi:hypothetical protein